MWHAKDIYTWSSSEACMNYMEHLAKHHVVRKYSWNCKEFFLRWILRKIQNIPILKKKIRKIKISFFFPQYLAEKKINTGCLTN